MSEPNHSATNGGQRTTQQASPDGSFSKEKPSPWITRLGGLVATAITLCLLIATERSLAIVWDEGFTLGREQRIRLWLEALRDPPRFASVWQPQGLWQELVQPDGRFPPTPREIDTAAKLFSQRNLEWFWPFARAEPHGHPPFYALVGLVGDVLTPSWELLSRARLGPMIVFSLAGGFLFVFLAHRLGVWPAAAAAGAWVLQPRLFAHAHYAHYDSILTSLWVASIMAFAAAVEPGDRPSRGPRWTWCILFGVLVGCALATKLTGWFLPLPFLAWTIVYRDRRGLITLIAGSLVAMLVVYALTPPWWLNPVDGIERFLRSNLSRSQTTKIPTMFMGSVIMTPKNSLPWYNTLVWTVLVTPVGFLAIALGGAMAVLRRWRTHPIGLLALGHWVFLLILRALPHTPGHDGERQFLAAFGCLTLVVGWGAAAAVARFGSWGKALIMASLAEGALSVALLMPVLLSYYSPLVGGLRGATRLGMEPTYYWDALTADALTWLNTHTPPTGKVLFATYPTIWQYLRQSGKLKPAALPPDPGVWVWYVLQNRPGGFNPEDRILVTRARPEHILVQTFGIPLIWVFPHAELERARKDAVGQTATGSAR